MRVLVTGGAGFIGSHIVDRLAAAGDDVTVLDDLSTGRAANLPRGVRLVVCDVRGIADVVASCRPDAICHQAAQVSVSRSVRCPVGDAEVNVVGTVAVLEAARRYGVRRVVMASSGGAIYGDVGDWTTEEAAPRPASPYACSKWAAERYLQLYGQMHSLECVALRYSNVYGPRQDPEGEAGVVARFCGRLAAGQPAIIYGDGRCVRDYVYVEDVARANELALRAHAVSPDLNISSGVAVDVVELEQIIREAMSLHAGRLPAPIYEAARLGDVRHSLPDPTLAKTALQWQPTVSLREGLLRTVAWYWERSFVS